MPTRISGSGSPFLRRILAILSHVRSYPLTFSFDQRHNATNDDSPSTRNCCERLISPTTARSPAQCVAAQQLRIGRRRSADWQLCKLFGEGDRLSRSHGSKLRNQRTMRLDGSLMVHYVFGLLHLRLLAVYIRQHIGHRRINHFIECRQPGSLECNESMEVVHRRFSCDRFVRHPCANGEVERTMRVSIPASWRGKGGGARRSHAWEVWSD